MGVGGRSHIILSCHVIGTAQLPHLPILTPLLFLFVPPQEPNFYRNVRYDVIDSLAGTDPAAQVDAQSVELPLLQ